MMHPRERSAIAATLTPEALLSRVRDVAGRDVGDPLNNQHDSAKLREQFDLTIEFNHSSVFAFNDDGMEAAIRTVFPDSQVYARRASCVAVASMWTPELGRAARVGVKLEGGE
jgi:hypothetical protein